MKYLFAILCLMSWATLSWAAEDTIYLEETVITGNQELPKVLYILPWQEMDQALLPQRAFDYDSQSLLVPIYPEEQRRELALRQTLTQMKQQASDIPE